MELYCLGSLLLFNFYPVWIFSSILTYFMPFLFNVVVLSVLLGLCDSVSLSVLFYLYRLNLLGGIVYYFCHDFYYQVPESFVSLFFFFSRFFTTNCNWICYSFLILAVCKCVRFKITGSAVGCLICLQGDEREI